MHCCPAVSLLIIAALIVSAGCLGSEPQKNGVVTETVPVTAPVTETTLPRTGAALFALNIADLPAEYILRERTVMISPEVTQISRELGWMQGYTVTFDRINKEKDDATRIRQSISIFPSENLKKVFTIEKDNLAHPSGTPVNPDEIPFPATGDRSIAYRWTNSSGSAMVVYTVIFTKKNAFERITMTGTTTDYEALKDIVRKAAGKIP